MTSFGVIAQKTFNFHFQIFPQFKMDPSFAITMTFISVKKLQI